MLNSVKNTINNYNEYVIIKKPFVPERLEKEYIKWIN